MVILTGTSPTGLFGWISLGYYLNSNWCLWSTGVTEFVEDITSNRILANRCNKIVAGLLITQLMNGTFQVAKTRPHLVWWGRILLVMMSHKLWSQPHYPKPLISSKQIITLQLWRDIYENDTSRARWRAQTLELQIIFASYTKFPVTKPSSWTTESCNAKRLTKTVKLCLIVNCPVYYW